MIHVHTHDDQCPFGGEGVADADTEFTDAELDAAALTGVLTRGSVSVPFADIAVLKVRAGWSGEGRTHAGTYVSLINDATGPYPISPAGLRRGAALMPPAAFEPSPQWDRYFGLGAFGLTADARTYLADPRRLTWGFELETQASAGRRLGDSVPAEATPEAYAERAALDLHDRTARDRWDALVRPLRVAIMQGTADLTAMARDFRAQLADHARRNGIPQLDARAWLQGQLPGLDVGTDGTVRGFEIRTVGGVSPDDFGAAAAQVFSVAHIVDTGCSFHIHCGLGGARTGYSEAFHSNLMNYLACHVDQMPASVRTRLADAEKRDSYFRPVLGQDKYCAVRFHPSGTWEFRLFGNVDTLADALQCRALAERAMTHALAVAVGDDTPLLTGTLALKWLAAFNTGRSATARTEGAA